MSLRILGAVRVGGRSAVKRARAVLGQLLPLCPEFPRQLAQLGPCTSAPRIASADSFTGSRPWSRRPLPGSPLPDQLRLPCSA